MNAIVVLFLLMDAGAKLAAIRPVLDAGEQIGFPGVSMARTLGAILLACTALYVLPRTSVLGAILLTAYLGGARIHEQQNSPSLVLQLDLTSQADRPGTWKRRCR